MIEDGLGLTLEEILMIINSCAKNGVPYTTLANLYELTKTHTLYKEEKERNKEKEEEYNKKILSLIGGKKELINNVTEEVRRWVNGTNGEFTIFQVYGELCITDKKNKDTVRYALKDLCNKRVIESVGRKTGTYRKYNLDFSEQSWWEDDGKWLPVKFPLGVEKYVRIYPGNIILLEGAKSQGKSSFCLEFARMNQKLYSSKILYQNIEMASSEIKERMNHYEEDGMWTPEKMRNAVTITRRLSDWSDIISPDAINIVDYLLEYSESFKLPNYIFDIHKKLKSGIALIAIQRDPLKPYGVGGRGTRDIPRLTMSMMGHKLRLEDVKSFHQGEWGNPTGMLIKYKKVRWWKFMRNGDWHQAADEKYQKYEKDDVFVKEEEEE